MKSSHHFSSSFTKTLALILLMACVIFFQIGYDHTKLSLSASGSASGESPEFIRLADMGFHPAVASFLWIETLPEILDLFYNGHQEYFSDLNFLNGVDPKFSYPYAFSV